MRRLHHYYAAMSFVKGAGVQKVIFRKSPMAAAFVTEGGDELSFNSQKTFLQEERNEYSLQ